MRQISYLGPEGTFTELALNCFLSNRKEPLRKLALSSISDLFSSLKEKKSDMIIVPIENSTEGVVTPVFDALLTLEEQTISSEILLEINQCLMTKGPLSFDEITDIVSHPQPIAQCRHYIQRYLPNARVHYAESTAEAAKWVSQDQDKKGLAVIGPQLLAEVYHLTLFKTAINDSADNMTRFFVLSTEDTVPTGRDLTTMIFSTRKDRPGSLADVLSFFSEAGINLTSISSRPAKKGLGDYLFYVDCEGHQGESVCAKVLEKVASASSFFKLLGSYEKGKVYR